MDSFLDDFFGGSSLSAFSDRMTSPSINIKETDTSHLIEVSAPGYSKDNFNISLESGIMTISSEFSNENTDENKGYIRREFSKSSFKRSFYVPEDVDVSDITAEYVDGILNIEVPKVEEKKPEIKTIKIK